MEGTETEEALRSRLQAGDREAWRSTLAELMPQLVRYAARLVGDHQSGEEVVQEAMVSVYRTFDRFEGRSSIKSWFYKAVHHRAIDELRRRKRYNLAEEEDVDQRAFGPSGHWADPPQAWEDAMGARLDARQLMEVVSEQLNELAHDYREVLLLREVNGLSTEEICETLEITPANMRVRLHRARKALRAAVDRALSED